MIRKFKVDVEAVQWTGQNLMEVINFAGEPLILKGWFYSFEDYKKIS